MARAGGYQGRIGVVLVGCGRMGRNHLRIIAEDPRFELKGVVDASPNLQIADSLLRGAPIFKSIDELGSQVFEAAVIATPTSTHFDVTKVVIPRARHILLEKPIAGTAAQSRELLAMSRKAQGSLFIGHVERFNPGVRKLKEVIEHGWLGEPIHLSATRVGGYPSEVVEGNNVLLDLAVHDLDVLASLIGRLKIAASICHSTWKSGVYDTAEIVLSGPKGVSASVHVNWITPTKIRSLRVTGTRGVCFVDYILQTCTLMGGNLLNQREAQEWNFSQLVEAYKMTDRVEFGVHKVEPLKSQLEHFHRAIHGQPHDLCSAEDATEAVALAETAMESSGKGLSIGKSL